jgi:hypothetical protein
MKFMKTHVADSWFAKLFILGLILTASSELAARKPTYTPNECPVVGNTNSRIYHVPGGRFYERMLVLNANGRDNRRCFASETEAQKEGYRRSKR